MRPADLGEDDLLEREAVGGAIVSSLRQAKAGTGDVLFIVGEAGLGKTSVLDHARRQAAKQMVVGFARGEEMESVVPFGLFGQAIDSLGEDVADLPGAAPAVEPAAPFHRVLRWLEQRPPTPILLAVDDLQWADADSLRLFTFIARRLQRFPIALIATLRPWPDDAYEACRALADSERAHSHRLAPLSRDAAGALLAARSEAEPSEEAEERAWELSGGNPLLVEQLGLALGRGEHLPRVGERTADIADNLLLARFAGLDPASMDCARAASALGTSFRAELAAEVAGLEGEAVDRALDALSGSGLVIEAHEAGQPGEGTRFAHPMFGQALYDDLSAARRRRLHVRCFRLLAERGLEEEACEHAIRAQPVGDQAAIEILARSGESSLAAGAVASGVRKLEAAVELSADRPTPELLRSFAQALVASGRMDEAAAVCRRLLSRRGLEWPERIEVLRMLGQALYLTGAADHGEGALREAVELGLEHDTSAAIQPLLDQSLSAWLAEGPVRALPLAARARELAQAVDDADLRELADATWGHMAIEAGDPAGMEGTAPVGRYFGPEGADLDPAALIWPWASGYQFAMNENYAERYESSQRAFAQIRAVVERAGAANATATAAIHIGNLSLRRGRLQEALQEGIRAEEFSELTPGAFPFAQFVQAEALVWLGRLADGEIHCRQGEDGAPGNWFARAWAAHVRGLRLLWEGDEAASDVLLELEEIITAAGIANPSHLHFAGHAIAAHLAVGREDDAVRLIESLEGARSLPLSWPRFAAVLGRARIAERSGEAGTADELFRAALVALDGVELPLERVDGLLAYGGFLRRQGKQIESRPHLAEALRVAEACEAGWLAGTAHEELRLAGGRRRRSVADRDLLTAAERRVAEQAKVGHSNAEIGRRLHLSVNTVETHLKRVYSKLEIRSRRQLMTLDLDERSNGSA